jgi:hypothetical protein
MANMPQKGITMKIKPDAILRQQLAVQADGFLEIIDKSLNPVTGGQMIMREQVAAGVCYLCARSGHISVGCPRLNLGGPQNEAERIGSWYRSNVNNVVQEISKHVGAFIACPGAQVYWWLRHCGCITADVNNLIRHCFTLSQQQKVTSSKYLKDLGHAVVERTDGDDIIYATTSAGIYDLTLGLSNKEWRLLVALRGYNTAAITYGEAKEGAVEAHNFSAALSVTSLHLAKGKGVEEKPGPTLTLAQ